MRIVLSILFFFAAVSVFGQGNYEIQVYESETVKPGFTMFELHSNFTFEGFKQEIDGVLPDNHQLHETLEITHGFTDWFEVGLYIFSSAGPNQGWQWEGDHIRPRVRVPESWKWPLGASLSTEIGYQRRIFSTDTWTWEVRPILDKQIDRWYLAFNPTFDKALHGLSTGDGWVFSPNVKVGYDVTKQVNAGFEYYGVVGPLQNVFTPYLQQHSLYPDFDLNLSPKWEFNFGVGVGMTRSTDHLIVKMILGYRFGNKGN
ncbi:MAG TPA: hypothetical protein VK419_01490 [Bryobacteraceae bacterium]|nr:hypothetical protein [Bryobacteraceae bacterium]